MTLRNKALAWGPVHDEDFVSLRFLEVHANEIAEAINKANPHTVADRAAYNTIVARDIKRMVSVLSESADIVD